MGNAAADVVTAAAVADQPAAAEQLHLQYGDFPEDAQCVKHHMSHVTRHTSHITRHTSHVTRHTSIVTRHTSHVTRHTSNVTRHTSHVTRHTSHVTRHTSHITRHTSHITYHTSHVTFEAKPQVPCTTAVVKPEHQRLQQQSLRHVNQHLQDKMLLNYRPMPTKT